MKKALVGKKLKMTQVFDENGTLIPVTVLELGPNVVVQKKTAEKDGYSALKVGFGSVKEKSLNKADKGIFDKAGLSSEKKKYLREIENFDDSLQVGSLIDCGVLEGVKCVTVTSISKGKGYAGNIKRHGFAGGRATHGSSFHRTPGSIGCRSFPGEVWKGKRMAGHMGVDQVTVKNLKVVKIIKDKNLILVNGAVPGRRDSLVIVCES